MLQPHLRTAVRTLDGLLHHRRLSWATVNSPAFCRGQAVMSLPMFDQQLHGTAKSWIKLDKNAYTYRQGRLRLL